MTTQMVDPVTLAAVTAALTHIGLKISDATVSIAMKELWEKIKGKLSLKNDLPKEQLAVSIATTLKDDAPLLKEILELIQANQQTASESFALVGNIQATNVMVSQNIKATTINFGS